jgi:hypothetical protein
MELAEYEASVAMHPLLVAQWNALPAEGRGPGSGTHTSSTGTPGG